MLQCPESQVGEWRAHILVFWLSTRSSPPVLGTDVRAGPCHVTRRPSRLAQTDSSHRQRETELAGTATHSTSRYDITPGATPNHPKPLQSLRQRPQTAFEPGAPPSFSGFPAAGASPLFASALSSRALWTWAGHTRPPTRRVTVQRPPQHAGCVKGPPTRRVRARARARVCGGQR